MLKWAFYYDKILLVGVIKLGNLVVNKYLLGEAYQRNDMTGFSIFLNLLDDDIEAAPYQMPTDGFEAEKYRSEEHTSELQSLY